MEDFFKYLSASDTDKSWGIYLNVVGKSHITSGVAYPSRKHPSGYYFSWENGRILREYQLIYITDGKGILETKHEKYNILSGNIIVIRKGEWQRYRPLIKTGWTEYYVGFDGKLADHFLGEQKVLKGAYVVNPGIKEELVDSFLKIFELVDSEEPGYQQIASSLIIKMIGYIVAFEQRKNLTGTRNEQIVQQVRFYLREYIENATNIKDIAIKNSISYSHLRKIFKEYTGLSPHQYLLDLKINKAKELLRVTNKSIKEISYDLGFESTQYFSRLFKCKAGISPTEFRTGIVH